jgi:hypothetical protein
LGALDRRQFLIGATGLAAGTWLLGPNTAGDFEEGPLGHLLHQSARLLSVGYVAGSHTVRDAAAALAHGAKVIPAAALSRSGRALRGLSTISIHGLTAGMADPVAAGVDGIHVDALVPAPADTVGQTTLPFFAWTMRTQPFSQSVGSSFAIDFDSKPRLGFAVDVIGRDTSTAGPARAVFATGRQPGMAKLQPGVYLLGLNDGAWDRVRTLPHPEDEAAWAGAGLTSLIVRVGRAA